MICQKCKNNISDSVSHCPHCNNAFSSIIKTKTLIRCPQSHVVDPSWTSCPACRWNRSSSQDRIIPKEHSTDKNINKDISTDISIIHENLMPVKGGLTKLNYKYTLIGCIYSFSRKPDGILYELKSGKSYFAIKNQEYKVYATLICHPTKIVLIFNSNEFPISINNKPINDDRIELKNNDTITIGKFTCNIVIFSH